MRLSLAAEPDGRLAERAIKGDDRAFGEIVRRYKLSLFRLVCRIIGNEDDALDTVQEAFIAAHRALARYDQTRSLKAWLTTIAINKARDWRRRERVRSFVRVFLPVDQANGVADERASPETEAGDLQALVLMQQKIAALPGNLREVLVLRAVEGLSQAETAQILGISTKAVETRLYRARQRLMIPGPSLAEFDP